MTDRSGREPTYWEWMQHYFPRMPRSVQALWTRILNTRGAYGAVFDRNKREVRIVLADLEWFCHANETTTDQNPIKAAEKAARRDVLLRIANMSGLSQEELFTIYKERLNERHQ